MRKLNLIYLVPLFFLVYCAKPKKIYIQTNKEEVTTAIQEDPEIKRFLSPYKDSLSIIMDSVIGYSQKELLRGRPESLLGNFMLDASLSYALKNGWADTSTSTIAMMNFGGLRSPINQGNITIGDIYKLMPFDNLLVIAKLPKSALSEIYEYNKATGGEPIAGFKIHRDKVIPIGFEEFEDTIEVVTTDYLYNGGDKMEFFEKSFSYQNTGVLLRDVLIEYTIEQDTIQVELENRIDFNHE